MCYNEEQLKLSKEFVSILKERDPQTQPERRTDIPAELEGCIQILAKFYAAIPENKQIEFNTRLIADASSLVTELQRN